MIVHKFHGQFIAILTRIRGAGGGGLQPPTAYPVIMYYLHPQKVYTCPHLNRIYTDFICVRTLFMHGASIL